MKIGCGKNVSKKCTRASAGSALALMLSFGLITVAASASEINVSPPAAGSATESPPRIWPAVMATAIRVTDLERSKVFYTSALGMFEKGRIDLGDTVEIILGFAGNENEPGILLFKKKGSPDTETIEHGNSGERIIIGVPDAETTAALITAGNGTVENIHNNGPYKVVIARDPDGYKLEIVQRP